MSVKKIAVIYTMKARFWLSIAGILTAPLFLSGQTTEEKEDIVTLNPFIIEETTERGWNSQQTFSATRAAESLLETPINIAIVNKDFLDDIGAENLMEALAYSASGTTQRVNYRDDITVRGFRTGPVRDGISYSSLGFAPLFDVDRLEVIKGPQAIVLSSISNIQGVVNYVTKRPTFENHGDFGVSFGSNNTIVAHATVSGPMGGFEDKLAYRVTAGFQESDGWRNGNDYNDFQHVSGSVDWRITNKLTVQLDAALDFQKNGGFNRGLADPNTGELVSAELLDPEFSTHAPWSFRDVSPVWRVRPTIIFQPLPGMTLRTLYHRNEFQYNYNIAQPVPGLRAEETEQGFVETIGQRFLAFDLKQEQQSIETDFVWEFGAGGINNRFMAGHEWHWNDSNQDLYLAPLDDIQVNEPFADRPLKADRSEWQTLFENRVSNSEGWSLYVGNNFMLWEDRITLAATGRYVDSVGDEGSQWVPRYGFVWRITKNFSGYFQYGKSFQDLNGADILGNEFVPITGESTEGGIKWNFKDGRVWGSLAYFDIIQDPVVTQISFVDPESGETIFGNAQVGKQTNNGIEADFGFILPAGPGEFNSLITLYFADPLNAEGGQFSRATKEKYSFVTKYVFNEGGLNGFFIGGGWAHTGASPGVGFPIQPAYDLYTMMGGFRAEKWEFIVNIDNVADNKRAVVGSEAAFSLDIYRPRYIRATVNYRW